MSIDKKEIELLKKGFEKLKRDFNLEKLEDEIEENTEYLYIPFPCESDNVQLDIDEVIMYMQEIETLKVDDYSKVTTDRITQRTITLSDYTPLFFSISPMIKNDIFLNIKSDPFLIGIGATKKGEYDEYHTPCTSNTAVELIYPNKESRLSDKEEEKLIKSYFFELSHTFKISFDFTTFHKPKEIEDIFKNLPESKLEILEDYNEGMDLFIKANQELSNDLKFLTYYKIFEYFSPIHSKIEAFEALRRKLDSSNSKIHNPKYLSSIFDLTKNYEKSIRDKELIKTLINNTFDLIDIFEYLPLSIRNGTKIKKLDYSAKKETIDRVVNHIGNVLYTTRNSIVHAKSNFESVGLECNEEDLQELNNFMHKACYSIIKWYNRLPKHLKIT